MEPLRIGIVDSGVNPNHPHVGESSIAAGTRIGLYRNTPGEHLDFLGHGTAVAGAILSHAPDVRLYIAKVFDKTLNTRIEMILHAIAWCVEEHAVDLVNLSLGTSNPAHQEALEAWTARVPLVCASGSLPGGLASSITVEEDPTLPRDSWTRLGARRFAASGRPRPIPGRSEDENLGGVSFAVANFTGIAAGIRAATGRFPWDGS